MEEKLEDIIRVSSGSSVQDVGAAIANACYARNKVVVRSIGAGATNQATKAIAVARGFAASRGLDLVARHGFATVPGRDGTDISAMSFVVFSL